MVKTLFGSSFQLPGFATNAAERTARAALDEWFAALQARDAQRVTDLYAPDALLLATFASEPLTSPKEVLAYFERLVANEGLRAELDQIRFYGDANVSVASGLYTFRFIQDGKPISIPARFTLTFERKGGRWLITSHHSSVQPSPL